MAELEREIHERVAALTPDQQHRVLDYIRGLGKGPPDERRAALAEPRRVTGKSGRDMLRFAGIWTDEEADEMKRLIEDAFERVEPDVR